MNKIKFLILTVVIAALGFIAPAVNAQNSPTVKKATTSTSTKKTADEVRVTKAQEKAGKEIERRLLSLNKLTEKIQEMKKIASTDKDSLVAMVQAQVTELNALKDKIADVKDLAALKEEAKSINNSYRTYLLVIPRTNILAATDRLDYIVEGLESVVLKLNAQIAELETAGKDTATLKKSIDSINTKIDSIKTQIKSATDAVVSLVPDESDKTVMAANKAALAKAKGYIKTATTDIKSIQLKFTELRKSIKTLQK